MKLRICAAAVAVLAGVSACSKIEPPADSLPMQSPGTAQSAAAPAGPVSANSPLADFSVDPGQVHACEGRDRVVSAVKWHVKDPAITEVHVDVDTATQPRTTFASGGGTGKDKTNDWVVAGVRFHLVDAKSGKELASYEVTSLPCD